MQAQFQYVPEKKTIVVQKVQRPAQFELTVRDRGEKADLNWDAKGKLIGEKVELWLGEQRTLQMLMGKLIIPIKKWGVWKAPPEYAAALVAVKEELTELCKQLPTLFPSTPKVDLLTGERIFPKFSVEFSFSEPKEEIQQVEQVTEAKVFFNPLFYLDETVQVDGLVLQPYFGACSSTNHASDTTWVIGRVGWLKVPLTVNWTPQEIESKFQALAKAIFEKAQAAEWNAPWKFTETKQICLE